MPKHFVGGINQCFRIIKAWKIFLQEKEISLFSVGNFFSHSAEKFREGNHSMFQKYAGMEYFSAEEGHINILRWNFFFLTVPKSFVRGIIQCFTKFRAWKNFMQRRGYQYYLLKFLFSHSAETTFRGRNYSMFQNFYGMDYFSAHEGHITSFC